MSDINRRRFLGLALAGAGAGATVLSGCSGGGRANAPKAGGGGSASNDGIVTIAVGGPDGSGTFPKNFNWYGANQNGTAPGLSLLFESPFELDAAHPGKMIPKLAESYDMEDDGQTMVFHLRKGVKWSDGVEMTAEDFCYTYGFVNGDACPDPNKCWAKKKPEAPDKYTAKIFFNDAEYQQMANYAMYYPIYPAHIWKNKDRKTDINENPVGTGPFTLDHFASQQVSYKVRDDYWGGAGKGVKQVKYVPQGPIGGVEAELARGQLDFASGSAQGVKKDFVDKDPQNNHYTVYPGGGSQIICFNCLKKPFNDVHVRIALRDALDLQTAAKLAAVGFGVPSVVGVDTIIYKDDLLPEYAQPAQQNVEGAKKALADGGWTVQDGALVKDGKSYKLSLRVDNGNPEWMQLGQVYVDQWQKTLGLKVDWSPTPTQVFNTKAAKGEYDFFASGGVSNGNWYQGYAQFSESNYMPIGEEPSGNYGRWKNKEVSDAVTEMSSYRTDDTAHLKPLIAHIQHAVAAEAPFIAAMTNTSNILWSSKKWTGFPEPGQAFYIPSPNNLNSAIDTVMNLSPAGS